MQHDEQDIFSALEPAPKTLRSDESTPQSNVATVESPATSEKHHDSSQTKVGDNQTKAPTKMMEEQSSSSTLSDPRPCEGSNSPGSPTKIAAGAQSGEELLKRLTLKKTPEQVFSIHEDNRITQSGLALSGRIISATFCLPYNTEFFSDSRWKLQPRRGTSALFDSFSYLASNLCPWEHTLVGWTGEIKERPPTRKLNYKSEGIQISKSDRRVLEKILQKDQNGALVPVWLGDSDDETEVIKLRDQSRWRTYAEKELHSIFHYKENEPKDGWSARKSWTDYNDMNLRFADRILEIYQPGDIVLIHDHHLLLLPGILRQRVPNIYIGFFLHVPFPSSEIFRCLGRRKEILEGVLGANMVGFQTYSYSRHFSGCCTRVLGFDSSSAGVDAYGAHVAVDVFPIGINALSAQKIAFENPKVEQIVNSLRERYAGKRIIVGRDRLDAVKGVAQKIQAFEMFLERYPSWRNEVVLVQVTNPNPVQENQKIEDARLFSHITNLVSKVNSKYGSLSFLPIQHLSQYLSKEEYFALLRVADVGLITSVRDGMNTTSLEYVICQKDNCGPLIVSEFSGTAGSLGSAIHINPWDLSGVADAINHALNMPESERRANQEKLYKHVVTNNVQSWVNSYLERLTTNLSSFDQSFATPVLDRAKLLRQYRKSKNRLFIFDYDGTLTPTVRDPQSAIPSDRVLRTLKRLASDPANSVWVVCERDQEFLDDWMSHIPELGLGAEHGSSLRRPHCEEWEDMTAQTDMSWQEEVMRVFQHYTEKTQGSFIERKKISLTWHYRRADPEYAAFQARECRRHLAATLSARFPHVEVAFPGTRCLEVRPRFLNKGDVARRIVRELEGEGEGEGEVDFVLCLGDGPADEDMFRALGQDEAEREEEKEEVGKGLRLARRREAVFAVTVGASSKQTLARWHLLEPADVIAVIAMLSEKE